MAWQELDGTRVSVPVEFTVTDSSTGSFRLAKQRPLSAQVAFAVGAYDASQPLWIDPTLTWLTFLGGGGTDTADDIAVDANGNVYVVGNSNAAWGSPVRAYTASQDAFVAKLDSGGALIWHTFLGGSEVDRGYDIAVDANGNVYVVGNSNAAWGSPRCARIRQVRMGTWRNWIQVARPTWHAFMGGSGLDDSIGVAADGNGNVYVSGKSNATWGTSPAPIRPYSAGEDAYAAKLNSAGARQWLTFLGGSGNETGYDIAVDPNGLVYVAGVGSAAGAGGNVPAVRSAPIPQGMTRLQ